MTYDYLGKYMERHTESATNAIFLAILFLIYAVYLAYWPWLNPKEWRKRTYRHRANVQMNWSFLPSNVVYHVLQQHPNFDLWCARIGVLVMIIWTITIIIIAYLGILNTTQSG